MKGTVVISSPVHWHFTWQSAQKVAAGLAGLGYRVIFIEPLPKRWPRLTEAKRVWGRLTGKIHLAGKMRQPLSSGVEIVSPRLLPDVGKVARAVNRRLFIPRLAQQLQDRQLVRPLTLINFVPLPAALALQERLQTDVFIYYCVHDWPHDPHTQDPGRFVEAEMSERADIVLADAEHNMERLLAYHHRVIQMIPSVDYDMFAPVRETRQQPHKEHPHCAYFGTLGANVDIDLLKQVSHHYPLRLIGPSRYLLIDFGAETEVIGAVPFTDLPHFLQDIDVLLLPYNRAPHIDGLVPAKLFECLATGKPVVAIGLTTLGNYVDLFTLCKTNDEFMAAIGRVYREDTAVQREARLACAREHSDAQRMVRLDNYIQEALAHKKKQVG
jgi:glycosyltransferase involved in cell wall biosynthesis